MNKKKLPSYEEVRMRMSNKGKRIYVSGPMSAATKEEFAKNVQHFHDAALLLRAQGYRVVNPARAWPCRFGWLYRAMERVMGKELAYSAVLCYDLWLLACCQTLCLIDGWRDSRGAKIEEHFAYHMGIVRSHCYDPTSRILRRWHGLTNSQPDRQKEPILTPEERAERKRQKRQRQREHRAAEKAAKESAAVQ